MSSPVVSFLLALGKFFFISVAASRLGLVARIFGLPVLIGFIAVGLCAGPDVLGLITKDELKSLSFITSVALAYICISAGAEMIIDHMRALMKRIVLSTLLLTAFSLVFGIGATAILSGSALLPWLDGYGTSCTLTIGAVFGVIFVTGSPAAVIALISELKAKGEFTNTVLGVTVLSDIVVLIVFAIASTSATAACKHESFDIITFLFQLLMLVAAGAVGWVFGRIIILLLWFKRFPAVRYLIIPLGYLVFVALNALTAWSHHNTAPYLISIEPLVVSIVAGFVASNASANRHRLLSTLANAGGLVFLPFFTYAGAGISIKLLMASLALALIFFVIRGSAVFFGTGLGGFLSAQPRSQTFILWATLLTQAGVSLGLAAEIGDEFEFGRLFQTSVISCVLVNSILGPVFFKIAMRRSGEIGKAGGDDEIDPDADVPTALVITSGTGSEVPEEAMSLTLQTLQSRWAVVLLCATQQEADAATAAVKAFAIEARKADQANKSAVKKVVDKVVSAPASKVKRLYGQTVDRLAGMHRELWRESQVLIDDYKENNTASATTIAGDSASVDLGTLNPTPDASSATGGTALNSSSAVHIEMTALSSPSSKGGAATANANDQADGDAPHDHEENVWKMEDHFQAICVSAAASPALTKQLHSVQEQIRLAWDLAVFFPSLAASTTAVSPPPGIASSTSSSDGADATTTAGAANAEAMPPAQRLVKHASVNAVVEMVRRTKTLQAVSVILPSLETTLAVSASVRVLLDGSPKKSHLHSVRVMSYLINSSTTSTTSTDDKAFWSKLLLSLSVVPVDSGAIVAAAASKLLTVAPTRPTVLLAAAPNNRTLAEMVAKKMPVGSSVGSGDSSGLRQRRQDSSKQQIHSGRSRAFSSTINADGHSSTTTSTSEHPCVKAAIELAQMDGKARVAACASAVASLAAAQSGTSAGEGEGKGLRSLIKGATTAMEKTTEHEAVPSWQRKDFVKELAGVQGASDGAWDGASELAALQGSSQAAKSAAERAEAEKSLADGNAVGAGAMPRLQRAVGDLLKGKAMTDESLGVTAKSARGGDSGAAGASVWGGAGIGGGIGSSSASDAPSFASSIGIALGSLSTFGSAAMMGKALETQERRKKDKMQRFREQEQEAQEQAVWEGEDDGCADSSGPSTGAVVSGEGAAEFVGAGSSSRDDSSAVTATASHASSEFADGAGGASNADAGEGAEEWR
jgi:Kef-type K+ transport system membrane component KefB